MTPRSSGGQLAGLAVTAAVEGDGPVEQGNDGVVRYSSAHIEPVESEFVVQPSSHSTQGNPCIIEEVRRILRLHAGSPFLPYSGWFCYGRPCLLRLSGETRT